MQENNMVEAPPAEVKKSSPITYIVIGILLLLLVVVGVFAYQYKNSFVEKPSSSSSNAKSNFEQIGLLEENQAENTTGSSDTTNPVKIYEITSRYKAFAQANKEGFVSITPIDSVTKPFEISKYGTLFSGGALGLGNTGVLLAPDLEKFAFVKDDAITVVSVDGEKELVIPLKDVAYINSWSPDSSSLLVYVIPKTIESVLNPEGPGSVVPVTFSVDQDLNPEGFVLINFKEHRIRQLHELHGLLVYSWAGNDELILSNDAGQNEIFLHYSLANKTVNTQSVAELGNVFGTQLSFSNDSKKWATVTSTKANSTEMAKATIGNFPTMGDIGSIEFPWATRQGPVLSPKGNILALMGYEILNGPTYLFLFDGKSIQTIMPGKPELWISDTVLLGTNGDEVFLYDTITKKSTQLRGAAQ